MEPGEPYRWEVVELRISGVKILRRPAIKTLDDGTMKMWVARWVVLPFASFALPSESHLETKMQLVKRAESVEADEPVRVG
ncbi:hypothetical protein FRUB_10289 [Fimbriiglobus ruber]|uniref:Uncharacterized protein n=2 Tax=Fimbriiglobus ruber TaxID=1908690 RepID=A0A225D6Z0_9BACT|nr:hypothetical protein FRUB_10289 [Fimbriiglobus ruber]